MSIRNLYNYINELLMDIDETEYDISEISKTIPNRKSTQINNKNYEIIKNFSIYKQTKYFGRILFLSDFASYNFGKAYSIFEEYPHSISTNLPILINEISDNTQILIKNQVHLPSCKLVCHNRFLLNQNDITVFPSSIKKANKYKINKILAQLIEKVNLKQKNLQRNIGVAVVEEMLAKELINCYHFENGYNIIFGKKKIHKNHFNDFHKNPPIIAFSNSCEIINNIKRNFTENFLQNYFLVNLHWKKECEHLVYLLKSKLIVNQIMKPETILIYNTNRKHFNGINEENEIKRNNYDNLMIPDIKRKTNKLICRDWNYLNKMKSYQKKIHKISTQSKFYEIISEKLNNKNCIVPIINVSLLNHEIPSHDLNNKLCANCNKSVKNISQTTSINLRKVPFDILNQKSKQKEIAIHNSPNGNNYLEFYEDTVKWRQIFRNPILQVVNGEVKLFKFSSEKCFDQIYKSNPYNEWLLTTFPTGLNRGIKKDSKGFNYKFSVYIKEDVNCHNFFIEFHKIKLTKMTKSEFQQWCMEKCQYNSIEIYEELVRISFNYKIVNQTSDKDHILKIIANKCSCYVALSDRFSHGNFGLCRAIQFVGVEKNSVLTCIKYLIKEINES